MILNKYELKKRLGKGAYGQVMLAQDKKGNKYAIKIITLKTFSGCNSYLMEYLQSQIRCLKQINSPYVMKLLSTEEDKFFKYMICQYCDGGDIISVQAKQPNKVFTLQKAIQILTFVIKGLECLHDRGYIHRDIKAENILMKTQNGRQVYKLSDFGFTKNIKDISFTILGTGAYMSPQIYNQFEYGFQVDMWAFGVLFYFMLNMEFPFKPHLAPNTAKKSQQLKKAATDFSYKNCVEKTRKKILANCTDDIQDLFKRIFNPNAKQRINFHDIRNHNIFKKYFPQSGQNTVSKILYKGGNKKLKNLKSTYSLSDLDKINATGGFSGVIKKGQQFQQQNKIIQSNITKIQFLKQILLQLEKITQLPFLDQITLKYNIGKYIIILIKQLFNIFDENSFAKTLSRLEWNKYYQSQQFKNTKKELQQLFKKCQFEQQKYYNDCQENLKAICQQNNDFQKGFTKKINASQFSGQFKISYRHSTQRCYQFLVQKIKTQKRKGNILNYQLCLVAIAHSFNKIFTNQDRFQIIFQDYFKINKNSVHNINYLQLKSVIAGFTSGQLNSITKSIITQFFSP